MEVTRRLDRLHGTYSSSITPPSVFYSPYQGILDRHKDVHQEGILSHLVYELLSEASSCGAIYTEFKFNLLRWLEAGLEAEEVYRALNDGMNRAYEEYGIQSNAILCIRRDFHPNLVEKLVSIVCETKMPKLVGIDLAGDERKHPRCDNFRDAFIFAKESGLKVTIHAGEYGGPENIWFAIEELGADRIGHGISSIRDLSLIKYLSSNHIMLEIAPSSNIWSGVITKYDCHPLCFLVENGVPISINTDNPVLLNTDLNKEFELADKLCGLSHDSLQKITSDSIRYSFADDDTKENLFQKVELYVMAEQEEDHSMRGATSNNNSLETQDVTRITMESYDRHASGYADYYYGRNLMKNHIEEFLSFLPNFGPVLDAGCGPGHDSEYIKSKGYKVIGIDISKGMIKEAQKRVNGIEFLHRDMCKSWPEKEAYFSGVWCCAALLHLTSQEANIALSNFNHVLQFGGILFLSIMRGSGDSISTEERPYGLMKRYFQLYEVEELTELITNHRFNIIKLNQEKRWLSCIARKV